MLMIRAIIRPERMAFVMGALSKAGFTACTEMDVYGRGKQNGITVGSVYYDELPKSMLLMVIEDEDKDTVAEIIINNARTGENGNIGDGRIFVIPVEDAYTISSRKKGL
jgi:nitrogen regulatory protein PII 1